MRKSKNINNFFKKYCRSLVFIFAGSNDVVHNMKQVATLNPLRFIYFS